MPIKYDDKGFAVEPSYWSGFVNSDYRRARDYNDKLRAAQAIAKIQSDTELEAYKARQPLEEAAKVAAQQREQESKIAQSAALLQQQFDQAEEAKQIARHSWGKTIHLLGGIQEFIPTIDLRLLAEASHADIGELAFNALGPDKLNSLLTAASQIETANLANKKAAGESQTAIKIGDSTRDSQVTTATENANAAATLARINAGAVANPNNLATLQAAAMAPFVKAQHEASASARVPVRAGESLMPLTPGANPIHGQSTIQVPITLTDTKTGKSIDTGRSREVTKQAHFGKSENEMRAEAEAAERALIEAKRLRRKPIFEEYPPPSVLAPAMPTTVSLVTPLPKPSWSSSLPRSMTEWKRGTLIPRKLAEELKEQQAREDAMRKNGLPFPWGIR